MISHPIPSKPPTAVAFQLTLSQTLKCHQMNELNSSNSSKNTLAALTGSLTKCDPILFLLPSPTSLPSTIPNAPPAISNPRNTSSNTYRAHPTLESNFLATPKMIKNPLYNFPLILTTSLLLPTLIGGLKINLYLNQKTLLNTLISLNPVP